MLGTYSYLRCFWSWQDGFFLLFYYHFFSLTFFLKDGNSRLWWFSEAENVIFKCPWERHCMHTCSFITSHSGWGHRHLNPQVIILQGHIEASTGCHSFIWFEFSCTDYTSKKKSGLLINLSFSAVIYYKASDRCLVFMTCALLWYICHID